MNQWKQSSASQLVMILSLDGETSLENFRTQVQPLRISLCSHETLDEKAQVHTITIPGQNKLSIQGYSWILLQLLFQYNFLYIEISNITKQSSGYKDQFHWGSTYAGKILFSNNTIVPKKLVLKIP